MKNYRDLIEYLNQEKYDEIFSSINKYINLEKPDCSTDYIQDPFETELEDFHLTSLYSERSKDQHYDVLIHARAYAEISITGYIFQNHHRDVDGDSTRLWLYLNIKCTFTDKLSIIGIEVKPDDERAAFKFETGANKAFIPYIRDEDLDNVALEMINQYVPDYLHGDNTFDPLALSLSLGLDVEYMDLPDNVFGQMVFFDKEIANENGNKKLIKRKTVLVDPKQSSMSAVTDERCTIVHECIHWILHQNFFKLLHLLNPELASIDCMSVDKDYSNPKLHSEDFKWIEWQANALTPRILMQKGKALAEYDRFLNLYSKENNPSFYKKLIDHMSREFSVSKAMAKIRLMQLGIKGMEGIYEYIDDDKVPSYCFDEPLKENNSYTGDYASAMMSLLVNPELKTLFNEGRVVYTQGFLVINDKKYVHRDSFCKGYKLTEYALSHIDECCFIFDVKKKFSSSFDDRYYSMCFACRTKNNDRYFDKTVDEKSEHNKRILEKARELTDFKEELEFAKSLPEDFHGCYKGIIDYLFPDGPNFSELHRLSKLDNSVISDYYYGRSKPKSKKQILALVAGLEISTFMIHTLLSTEGYIIKASSREQDIFYCELINDHKAEGVDSWNEYILAYNKPEWLIPESARKEDYI